LKNPILKYLTATLPAKEIRAQASDQRHQLERVKAESEGRVAQKPLRSMKIFSG